MRDSQKNKVYSWERANVAPYDQNEVDIENVKPIVDWIWQSEGLLYPPTVEALHKNCTTKSGTGNRTRVRFLQKTKTWIILHELSHSMTCTVDGESNFHGALFLGIYIQLLHRYLKIPYDKLVNSAKEYGLEFKLDARPVFL